MHLAAESVQYVFVKHWLKANGCRNGNGRKCRALCSGPCPKGGCCTVCPVLEGRSIPKATRLATISAACYWAGRLMGLLKSGGSKDFNKSAGQQNQETKRVSEPVYAFTDSSR